MYLHFFKSHLKESTKETTEFWDGPRKSELLEILAISFFLSFLKVLTF